MAGGAAEEPRGVAEGRDMERKQFQAGCFEVKWLHASDRQWRETSQVEASDADEAVAVVRDGDDGYGQVGPIVSVKRRRELERR